MKKLKDPMESLNQFINNISALKQKLGPILFQLPPGWEINVERFENFLKHVPRDLRCVFEFRNTTWYDPRIYKLLTEYNCAFCIYELAGHLSPLKITADFVYLRLHGPGEKYQGSYPEDTLQNWALQCNEWIGAGLDVFVYFDNDERGYAAFNAIRIKEILNIK